MQKILALFILIIVLSPKLWGYVPSRIVYVSGLDSLFISGTQQELTDLARSFDPTNANIETAILCNEAIAAAGYYRLAYDSYLELNNGIDHLETDEGMLQKAMVGINLLRVALDCDLMGQILIFKGIIDNQIEHIRNAGMLDKYLMYDYYSVFTRDLLYAELIKEAALLIDEFSVFMDREFPDLSPQRSEFFSLKGSYQARIGDYTGAYESYKQSINPYISDGVYLTDTYGVTLASSLCQGATFLMSNGDRLQAVRLGSDAFNILKSSDRIHTYDYKAVCALLAANKANEGDYDTAIAIVEETMNNDNAIHANTGLPYNMLANRFILNVGAKRVKAAMDDFAILLATRRNKLWCNLHLTAGISELCARFLLDMKKYADALDILKESKNLTDLLLTFPKRGYYQDLARSYLGLEDYKNASLWYNRLTDDIKEEVRHHFICFAEKQRENFWETVGSYLLPIMAYLPEGTPGVGSSLFNSAMFAKGLLLKTSRSIASTIANIKDGQEELNADFALMRDLKAKAYFDPDNKQLAEKASVAERRIMQRLGLNPGSMRFVDKTWQDIRDRLKEDEVAINFVYAGEEWAGIYADWNGWYAAEIISKEFAEPIHVPLFRSDELPQQLSELWSRKLVKYVHEGNTIFIVLAGAFHNEPIECLPFSGTKLLNDVCTIVRLSSMHELLERSDFNSPVDVTKGSVMYGGLNYNLDIEDMELIAMENTDRGSSFWGYLPGTLEEVNAIGELVMNNSRSYTGNEGIEETFKSLSGRAPHIIHIATHGYYMPDNLNQENSSEKALARCGLVFTGANNFWGREMNKSTDQMEDGLLTGSEIATLDLSGAELVTLSACQTGVGKISTEGVFGLQRAFKLAGAQSLLVTLREVNDQVTSYLMKEFYTALASGVGRRSALHIAQDKVRNNIFTIDGKEVSGSDPCFWACFVLID